MGKSFISTEFQVALISQHFSRHSPVSRYCTKKTLVVQNTNASNFESKENRLGYLKFERKISLVIR